MGIDCILTLRILSANSVHITFKEGFRKNFIPKINELVR